MALALAAGLGWAGDDGLGRKFASERDLGKITDAIETHRAYLGPKLAAQAEEVVHDEREDGRDLISASGKKELLAIATAAEASHRTEVGPVQDPKATARDELKKAGYRDPGKLTSKNWAAHGLDKLWKWLDKELNKLRPSKEPASSGILGLDALTPIMWALILLAVAGFLFFAARHFTFAKRRRVAKAGGLLEDDEPDRSADEWLTKADELEARGEFRLAVRCLYVASLVRLDEANVARFRRGETNWEHLHRIEASPSRPVGLDFRPPTERFDHVWYGRQGEGKAEVARFREWYTQTLVGVGKGRKR